MLLDVDGARHELLASGEPFSFAGEARVHADCIGGETTDLNIMTRRDRATHRMHRQTVDGRYTTSAQGLATLIVALEEGLHLGDEVVGALDTIVVEPRDGIVSMRSTRPTTVVVVDIRGAS